MISEVYLELLPVTPSIKIAQKPQKIGSLGPKALKYESFEGKGVVIALQKLF